VGEGGRGENMGMPDGVKKSNLRTTSFENEDSPCLVSLCWKVLVQQQ